MLMGMPTACRHDGKLTKHDAQVVKRGYKRYLRHLTTGSPFRSSQTDAGCVLAFELEWKNIGGIDYSNPLCLPGRLVLESKSVLRREFCTVGSCHFRSIYLAYGFIPRTFKGMPKNESHCFKKNKGRVIQCNLVLVIASTNLFSNNHKIIRVGFAFTLIMEVEEGN